MHRFHVICPCYLLLGSSCQIKEVKRDDSPIQGVSRAGMKAMRNGIATGTGATGEAKDERQCRAHVARSEGGAKGERTGRGWKCRATSKQYAKEKKMS